MAAVEFVGQSASDSDNRQAATSRLINFYREPVAVGDKTRHTLKTVLGRSLYADTGSLSYVNDIEVVGGDLYAVVGGDLYSFTTVIPPGDPGPVPPTGSVTLIGNLTLAGPTAIAGNNGNVTITNGGSYYVWDGTTLTEPAAGAFSGFGSVEYFGGYTVLTESQGRLVQWSDLADPTTLPALNFATTEARDDDNIRAVAIGGNLWIFKETSTEIWAITGEAGAGAIAPITGAVIDTGLKGFSLVTKVNGGAFLIGNDGIAYITDGGGLRPASTPAVETAISEGEPESCLYYEDEGHKFCVITFRDRPSWCLDISTGEWHERADGADHGPWGARCAVKFGQRWIYGDDTGKTYWLYNSQHEGAEPIRRTAVSRTLANDQQLFVVDKMEFLGRFGFGGVTPAECWIRVSRDDGMTWGDPKYRSLGADGAFEQRVTYRGMGQFRQATVELNISDIADVAINATASVDIS